MDYILKRYKRSRNIRIRVDHDGNLVVSAPIITPKLFVNQVVGKNKLWIDRERKRISMMNKVNPIIDWDNMILSYLGIIYLIKVSSKFDSMVKMSKGVVYVSDLIGNKRLLKKSVLNWLKQQGRIEIYKRVKKWSKLMKIDYKRIRISQQKSRWGSCSSSGTLSFNWRLIHFPIKVMDYVVIHELSHVEHPNHSNKLWMLVEEYEANYKNSVKLLKKQRLKMEVA